MMTDYRTIDGVNQSSLKKILTSPTSFIRAKENQDSDESFFVFGKLVDYLMFSPEEVSKIFIMTDVPEISETLSLLCKYVIEYCAMEDIAINLESPRVETAILKAHELHGYQSKWGDDAKLKNFKKNCEAYIKVIQKANGKTIISQDDYNKALICKAALTSNVRTNNYFKYIGKKDSPIEVSTHKIVEFTYNEVECKGELDGLVINHNTKEIIPFDLKTTGQPLSMFPYQFWKLRYDFQAAFYVEGLLQDEELKELITNGYTIQPFKFIVVETNCVSSPLIFEADTEVLNIGKYGGTLSTGKKLEGFDAAITRYKFHQEKDNWDYPMEYYKGNIKIEI